MRQQLARVSNTSVDRRRYLRLLGAGTVGGLAGCLGNSNQGETSSNGSNQGETSSNGSNSSNLRGGHFRISVTPKTATINPLKIQEFTERWGAKLFYSTLTRVSPDLKAYGDLAKDWTSNDSADEWTFTLREATFHDGNQVTASDVEATFKTVYGDSVGSPGKGTMGDIQQVKATDEKTVKFTLGVGSSDFPKLISKGWGSIIPQDIVTNPKRRQELGTNEHGSGAFTLEEFSPGNKLTGVSYDDYYRTGNNGKPLPYVDKVSQIRIPGASNQVNALRSGDTDYMWQPDYGQWGKLQNSNKVKANRTPGGEIAPLVMKTSAEPWSDPRVRGAVKHAVDRKALLTTVQNGLGGIGQDTPISPAYANYADIGPPERNLEKAKNLLAEAGYPDGINLTEEFGYKLQTASNISHMRGTAVGLKSQLKKIGIEFGLETMPYSTWSAKVWQKAPFYVAAYGMRISGAAFMKTLLHSEGAWNAETDWSNDQFDKVINKAIATTNKSQKQKYMKTAQRIVREKGPYLIPFYIDTISGTKEYVKKYKLNPLAYEIYPDEYALGADAPTK